MQKYKLLMIGFASAAIIIGSCKTHFETSRINYTSTKSVAAFARGKNLAYNICGQCHYSKSDNKFIGGQMKDVPGFMGKVYAANLTNSKSHGVAPQYSDAQLKYLLKTGIAKDGRFIPYMLRPNLADDDINAIIVYLRSDDAPVAAADTTTGITHLTMLGKIATSLTGKPVPYKTGVKLPDENNGVANGRYLVDNVGCFHCHSKSFTSLNYVDPEQSKGYMAGGLKFKTPEGEIYAANLTPDKQTGIGNYTKNEFRRAVKDGEAPHRHLHPPMPRFRDLNDKQVDDIYSYLQSLPAKSNKINNH